MYTATYALILVFIMLCVAITGVGLKFHRVRMQFKSDKKGLKNSIVMHGGNGNANHLTNQNVR